jgi:ATP/ADP translocase
MKNFIVRFFGFMKETVSEIGKFVLTMSLLSYVGGLLSGEVLTLNLTGSPEFIYYSAIANLVVAPIAFALVVPSAVMFVATCTSIIRALPERKIRIY